VKALLGVALIGMIGVSTAVAQDSVRTAEDIPPAGFGTLHQDDLSLRLEVGDLRIKVLPLDERVIRLLAPDSYESMHRLKTMKATAIDSAAAQAFVPSPNLFVVTFYGLLEQSRFNPEEVNITSRGRFFRPVGILSVSPRWGENVLRQRETAVAVYLFEAGIEVLEPFTVSYAHASTNAWERTLRTLDQERAAVIARAAAVRRTPPEPRQN
jgi:hypothetical protein